MNMEKLNQLTVGNKYKITVLENGKKSYETVQNTYIAEYRGYDQPNIYELPESIYFTIDREQFPYSYFLGDIISVEEVSNNDSIIARLKEVAITNQLILDDYNNDIDKALQDNELITFTFNGFTITNPFYDESLRHEVNPIEYYGIEALAEIL